MPCFLIAEFICTHPIFLIILLIPCLILLFIVVSAPAPSSSTVSRPTKYTHQCPHCGRINEHWASSSPNEWTCSDCKCHYLSDGTIFPEILEEYRVIDHWQGLDDFIEVIVRCTKNSGWVYLKDGFVYHVDQRIAGSKGTLVATYPAQYITLPGELHLMYLCMQEARYRHSDAISDNYLDIWLMDRGLAWEWKFPDYHN